MVNRLKVTIIGAGSASFGPISQADLYLNTLSNGGTLGLVDLDQQALDRATRLSRVLSDYHGAGVEVVASTDRNDVLAGSDVVMIAAETNRISSWRKDWQIPQDFGIAHTLGENRGPAGLSHTLRTVPLVLDMCRDIERLCPKALVLIMTNPEDRIAYAVNTYANIQAYGFCDGLWDFKHKHFEPLMGIKGDDLYLEGYGINHAVWITEMRQLSSGENLYDKFVQKARKSNFEPFGLHLYEQFGLWPHENDEHYGEYFSNACEFINCKGYDFDGHLSEQGQWESAADRVLDGTNPVETFWNEACETMWDVFGDSPPSAFIAGVKGTHPQFIQNVNVANNGIIDGLPDDMIVEVPGVAAPSGLHGMKGKALPFAITSFLAREGAIQRLSAEAAYEGSREKALLALELDSHVTSTALANRLLDAFIEAHYEILPQKQRDSLGTRSNRIAT